MRPFALALGRLAAVVVLALAAWTPTRADPTFPPLTGRVVDNAHVLSPAVQADLTAKLAALEARRAKTRDLKQGMMQELLTGRIRLV